MDASGPMGRPGAETRGTFYCATCSPPVDESPGVRIAGQFWLPLEHCNVGVLASLAFWQPNPSVLRSSRACLDLCHLSSLSRGRFDRSGVSTANISETARLLTDKRLTPMDTQFSDR